MPKTFNVIVTYEVTQHVEVDANNAQAAIAKAGLQVGNKLQEICGDGYAVNIDRVAVESKE